MRYLFRSSQSLFVCVVLALAAPAWAQTTPADGSSDDACGTSAIDFEDEAGLTQEERIRRMDAALIRSLNQFDECQDDEARTREEEQQEQDPDPLQQNAENGGATSSTAEGTEGEGSENEGAEGGASAEGAESEGESDSEGGNMSSAAAGGMTGTEPGPESGQSGAMPLPGVIPSLPSSQAGSAGQGGSGGASGASNGSAPASGVGGEPGSENMPAGPTVSSSGGMTGTEPVAPPQQAGVAGGGPENEGQQAGTHGSRENTGVAGTGPRALPNGKLPEDIPPADNDSVLEAQIRQAAINETDPELKKKLWNEYRRYKGLPQVN